MKQYIGISRDHSMSMQGITRPAARDYNDNIATIKEAAREHTIDSIVSVVRCGSRSGASSVVREVVNSSALVLQPILENEYRADGPGTPLFDSVGELITMLESTPDALDPDVTFLVMAITDGEENSSRIWNATKLSSKIARLVATDRWTFVFRVPRGYGQSLSRRLGIPIGNILEWDQTQRGVEQASAATRQAFTQFYADRASGVKSTGRFYANLAAVKPSEVKAALTEVSGEVQYFHVPRDSDIRTFIEDRVQGPLMKGAAFYQLTKTEDVQDHKEIAVRDKTTAKTYSGKDARDLLGLPHVGQIRLSPGNNGNFDVFVQSTSTNRKLISGTEVLYWPNMAR